MPRLWVGLGFFLLPGCMEALQLFSLPSIYALGACYPVTRDNRGVEKMLFKKKNKTHILL